MKPEKDAKSLLVDKERETSLKKKGRRSRGKEGKIGEVGKTTSSGSQGTNQVLPIGKDFQLPPKVLWERRTPGEGGGGISVRYIRVKKNNWEEKK